MLFQPCSDCEIHWKGPLQVLVSFLVPSVSGQILRDDYPRHWDPVPENPPLPKPCWPPLASDQHFYKTKWRQKDLKCYLFKLYATSNHLLINKKGFQ